MVKSELEKLEQKVKLELVIQEQLIVKPELEKLEQMVKLLLVKLEVEKLEQLVKLELDLSLLMVKL
jgi:hypothetical protein